LGYDGVPRRRSQGAWFCERVPARLPSPDLLAGPRSRRSACVSVCLWEGCVSACVAVCWWAGCVLLCRWEGCVSVCVSARGLPL